MSRATDASIASFVDGDRLWGRLERLARFGATPNGGVHRLALSPEEAAARSELVAWGREIGLEPFTDEAANLFLRLEGREPALPPLLVGSHIDTQPTGGKYDGAYGVVAAFEALQAIRDSGRRPRRSIELVAWMNEEGSRFAPGMMGSAVFTGRRTLEDVMAVTDRDGVSLATAAGEMLAADVDVARRPLGFPVAGFLEAHIEQGPLLEEAGIPIGLVTGIQGKKTFRVEIVGEESHAGTTPRARRRDALVSAVAVIGALQDAVWDGADSVRFTIGMLTLAPNAPSVVPGRVTFSIDLRHDDRDTVLRLGEAIPQVARAHAGRCDVTVRELLYDEPLSFPEGIRRVIAEAASSLALPYRELPSPAGHDSRYLHGVAPTGMIFIPCAKGISHNEAECIAPADATAGARLLAEAGLRLAEA